MSEKYDNTCQYSSYLEHLLILVSTVTGCISITVIAALVAIPVGIRSSLVLIKLCKITGGIKKYKSITKEKNKKHDKIVFLGKHKLNTSKVLSSKPSYISYYEFVSVNNVLTEHYEMKEEIKNPETSVKFYI